MLASRDLPQEMLFDISPIPTHESSSDYTLDAVSAIKNEGCSSNSNAADEAMDTYSTSASITTTLVHRHTNSPVLRKPDVDSDSSSEEEGFLLVHRPKPRVEAASDDLMSSPELIPSAPLDILAATGSDYSSDGEWSLV